MATVAAETPNLRPLRIGEILDVAIKVYTRNAATLFRIVAIVIIPVQVIGLFIILSTFPDSLADAQANPFLPDPNAPVPEVDFGEVGVFFVGTALVWLLNFIGVTLATGACFKAVTDAYLGAKSEWRSSMRFALQHLPSLLWVTFLVTLVSVIGLVFCLAPGIWMWAALAVATPALLTEGQKGTKAMGRSFSLVQNRWWNTFAVLLIAFALAAILSSILGGFISVLTFTDVGENFVLIQSLNAIATAIASILATPFQAAVVAVLYFDLRVRKEGFDLQLLAQRMGTDTPEGAHAALLPPPIPPALYGTPGTPPGAPPYAPAPQSGGPYQPAYPTYQAPQVNGMAIASLICGVLWLFWVGSIIAVVMGSVARRQIAASNGAQGGKGLATAGIVLGSIGLAILGLVVLGAVSS